MHVLQARAPGTDDDEHIDAVLTVDVLPGVRYTAHHQQVAGLECAALIAGQHVVDFAREDGFVIDGFGGMHGGVAFLSAVRAVGQQVTDSEFARRVGREAHHAKR